MDLEKYKKRLEKEKKELAKDISSLGVKDPQNPGGFVAKEGDFQIDEVKDVDDLGTEMEGFAINNIVLRRIEERFNNVELALEKIESGEFGKCRDCSKKIEADRLEANPAAQTCKKHMK